MTEDSLFSIEQEIITQKELEGEKQKPFHALENPVNAKSHTSIYKMHRYYARRPWNVFKQLIEHYTEAGDIILDPFCGGGVTIVEGLKLKRRVIGIDLNPLATFVTQTEVKLLNVEEFSKVFKQFDESLKNWLTALYKTKCRQCGSEEAQAEWYEWSHIYECPECKARNVIDTIKKKSAGKYICRRCNSIFSPLKSKKKGEILVRLLVKCEQCKTSIISKPNRQDIQLAKNIANDFEQTIAQENLWYPKDEFPDGDLEKDHSLFKKGITHFYKLFTSRNLLASAYILKKIREFPCEENLKEFLYLCFSGTLRFSNKMVFRNVGWQGGKPIEWAKHAYWLPNVYCEINAYKSMINRMKAIMRGKKESKKTIGKFYQLAEKWEDFKKGKSCLLLNQSASILPFPDKSVDCIITDPPFGGNVQYAELSDFWVVWLKDVLNTQGIIDNHEEAIQTRHGGFPTEKSLEHYEEMLYKIFKECRRVLKSQGWMVMTFHNRDVNVWMALHRAANRAGFKLPPREESEQRGMLYQPPIKSYTTTIHQRATGSMLGDFILSFKKIDNISQFDRIRATLSLEQEEVLINKINELILYHGGADDNAIMTCLIPALNELNIFHQTASFNWEEFLAAHFKKDRKTQKWYTKSLYNQYYDEEKRQLRPIDYIPAEDVTKNLLYSFIKEKGFSTLDELLTVVYSQLVNSHRPGIEAIHSFIVKYCQKTVLKGKTGYILKDEKLIVENTQEQMPIFGQAWAMQSLSHNEIIHLIARYALESHYTVHVGKTEQRKEKTLKALSIEMLHKEDYGIASNSAFHKIKEIDLLVLQNTEIPAAFEVTTSINTAREAINDRFRDLFSILPNTKIKTFVVVKDDDFSKVSEMINSVANLKEGIASKIRPLKLSHLSQENFIGWLEN